MLLLFTGYMSLDYDLDKLCMENIVCSTSLETGFFILHTSYLTLFFIFIFYHLELAFGSMMTTDRFVDFDMIVDLIFFIGKFFI